MIACNLMLSRKDALCSTFALTHETFKPIFQNTTTEIPVAVRRPSPADDLLGFMRFRRKTGDLEITNFDAQLQREKPELGGTTKKGQINLAGTHGEGFKIAALDMRRTNHKVEIRSTGFSWNCFSGQQKLLSIKHLHAS